MKITYFNNACCVYESSSGFRLMTDPWLTNGAFEGSWYHPLNANMPSNDDIRRVNALYISHIHPDHFDPEALKRFNPITPVIVLDHGANFLHKKLFECGFENLVKLKDGESIKLDRFRITMYAPFVKSPFDQSELGNLLDSAIVIEDEKDLVLNANDNMPDLANAKKLRDKHGPFTISQLKYAIAGAYPQCFLNLTQEQKSAEKERLLERLERHNAALVAILGGEAVSFAGSYILAGSLAHKNKFLAVDGIDLNQIPEGLPYDYEKDEMPVSADLYHLCEEARDKLVKVQLRFKFFPDYSIAIKLGPDFFYKFNFKWDNMKIGDADLTCILDPRLLKRILLKKSHWNNAEVGSHIDFIRLGHYEPDISTIMSFFHT